MDGWKSYVPEQALISFFNWQVNSWHQSLPLRKWNPTKSTKYKNDESVHSSHERKSSNKFYSKFRNNKYTLWIFVYNHVAHGCANFASIAMSNILTSRLTSTFTIPSVPSTPINLPVAPRCGPPIILILSVFLGGTISISFGSAVIVSPFPLEPRTTLHDPSCTAECQC